MTAIARLDDGMRLETGAGSWLHIFLDASSHAGGTGAGFVPIEMLLIGLAGYTGMDVISIMRKTRQDVITYEMFVHGIRAETAPMVFTEITLEHCVAGRLLSP